MANLFKLMEDVPFSEMKDCSNLGRSKCREEFFSDGDNCSVRNFDSSRRRGRLRYTSLEWSQRRASQKSCEVCRKVFASAREKHGDHDHKTGEWRGVVCARCNVAIGYLEAMRDDPTWMAAIEQYLERNRV